MPEYCEIVRLRKNDFFTLIQGHSERFCTREEDNYVERKINGLQRRLRCHFNIFLLG